jgi:hypothetical protein
MTMPRSRWAWMPTVAAACAIAACYGTSLTVAVLASLGVAIVVDEGAWSAAIVAFALLAVAGVGIGGLRRGRIGPVALASLGAAVVLWSQFGSYDLVVELAGFAALIGAAIWDRRGSYLRLDR